MPSLSVVSSQVAAEAQAGNNGGNLAHDRADKYAPATDSSAAMQAQGVMVAGDVTIVGGKRQVTFGKARPKKGFKASRLLVFVHELQRFVQVVENETKDVDWTMVTRFLTQEDRWRWMPATLLLRFQTKTRKVWFQCQIRIFCRVEVNIRGEHLVNSIKKAQDLYDGVKDKFGADFAAHICNRNFPEHLYGNMTFPNTLLQEKCVKIAEAPQTQRVTEAEAEEVTVLQHSLVLTVE